MSNDQAKEEERGDNCPCPEDIEGFVLGLSNQQKWAFCRALLKHHTGPMVGTWNLVSESLKGLREASLYPSAETSEEPIRSGDLKLAALDMLEAVSQRATVITRQVIDLLSDTSTGIMNLAGLDANYPDRTRTNPRGGFDPWQESDEDSLHGPFPDDGGDNEPPIDGPDEEATERAEAAATEHGVLHTDNGPN